MYIVTGSTGLIGFSTSEYFLKKGIKVLGIDNDMRSYFFGKKSSNKWKFLMEKVNLSANKTHIFQNKLMKNKCLHTRQDGRVTPCGLEFQILLSNHSKI